MSHGNRNRRLRRPGAPLHPPGGFAPGRSASDAHEAGQGWKHPSEEYFGREPFTYGREPRYYGTGVPGYVSGPGYTGGPYGYGDEPPDIPTELERAYAYDVYGYGPGTYDQGHQPAHHRAQGTPPRVRKYPPGPKGYVRSDERIREDVCDRIAAVDDIDSSDVTVEVLGGKVVLDGTVPKRRMKHAIEDIADACPGVRDIDDRIRVQPSDTGSREAVTREVTRFPPDAPPIAPTGMTPGLPPRMNRG